MRRTGLLAASLLILLAGCTSPAAVDPPASCSTFDADLGDVVILNVVDDYCHLTVDPEAAVLDVDPAQIPAEALAAGWTVERVEEAQLLAATYLVESTLDGPVLAATDADAAQDELLHESSIIDPALADRGAWISRYGIAVDGDRAPLPVYAADSPRFSTIELRQVAYAWNDDADPRLTIGFAVRLEYSATDEEVERIVEANGGDVEAAVAEHPELADGAAQTVSVSSSFGYGFPLSDPLRVASFVGTWNAEAQTGGGGGFAIPGEPLWLGR